jgi:hypothetical protein
MAMAPTTSPAVCSAVLGFSGTPMGPTFCSRTPQQPTHMGAASGRVRRSQSGHMKLPQRGQMKRAGSPAWRAQVAAGGAGWSMR